MFKETVSIIQSDPPCKVDNTRFFNGTLLIKYELDMHAFVYLNCSILFVLFCKSYYRISCL